MKKSFGYIVLGLLITLGLNAPQAFAGNKDRSGQAGAAELLINPWAASSGWGNAGMSKVHGLDAMFGNVAGISSCKHFGLELYAYELARRYGKWHFDCLCRRAGSRG